MNTWGDMLGPLAWPLIFCSLVMFTLILERFIFFITLSCFPESYRRTILTLARTNKSTELPAQLEQDDVPNLMTSSANMRLGYRRYPRHIIEDAASLWQVELMTKLQVHLTWLRPLAVASPLLVLLGTVQDVMLMGRRPHHKNRNLNNDYAIVRQVMKLTGTQQLRERIYTILSGGERQRLQFARILTQIWGSVKAKTRYLMLDEPTSELDLSYQHDCFRIACCFAKEQDAGVLHSS